MINCAGRYDDVACFFVEREDDKRCMMTKFKLDYLRLLERDKVTLSMSDVGRCYDNAMQESFWGTLKTERANRPFPLRTAARKAIFEYIEVWYNRQRRHSALEYLSPCVFKQLHCP